MQRVLNQTYAYLKKDALLWASYRWDMVFTIINMLLAAFTYAIFGNAARDAMKPMLVKYQCSFFEFLIVGMAFNQFMAYSLDAPRSAIHPWNLEYALLTPVRMSTIVIGSSIHHYAWNAASVGLYFLVSMLFFDLQFHISPSPCILTILLGLLAMWGCGLMSAGVQIITKRWDPVTWLFSTASLLLAGVYFPIEALPKYVRVLSYLLPQTYILRLMRLSILADVPIGDVWLDLTILGLMAMVAFPLGYIVFQRGILWAKRYGTLGHE